MIDGILIDVTAEELVRHPDERIRHQEIYRLSERDLKSVELRPVEEEARLF